MVHFLYLCFQLNKVLQLSIMRYEGLEKMSCGWGKKKKKDVMERRGKREREKKREEKKMRGGGRRCREGRE